MSKKSNKIKRINLALQGGGAHGAFTWGVLDRLLQEDDIEIAAISGASAGALNGAALKAGLASASGAQGREAARENLNWLWAQVGAVQDLRLTNWMSNFAPPLGTMSQMIEYSLPVSVADMASHLISPYAYGPYYRNPLQKIAERFQYDKVCGDQGPQLHIGATNVRTGKVSIFTGTRITPSVILASACLPSLFQAIEIEDPKTGVIDPYWDGGYTGNPALFPLFDKQLPDDILVVNINPLERAGTPKTPQEIDNRLNEISFNSSLLRELRAIQFVKDLIHEGHVGEGQMKNVLIHMIADDDLMRSLNATTKLVPTPLLLAELKAAGIAGAEHFLTQHRDKIGSQSSVDLRAMFD